MTFILIQTLSHFLSSCLKILFHDGGVTPKCISIIYIVCTYVKNSTIHGNICTEPLLYKKTNTIHSIPQKATINYMIKLRKRYPFIQQLAKHWTMNFIKMQLISLTTTICLMHASLSKSFIQSPLFCMTVHWIQPLTFSTQQKRIVYGITSIREIQALIHQFLVIIASKAQISVALTNSQ